MTTENPTPRLSIHEVAVRRGGREILHSVTLDVAPGEAVAIIGPSGSGKTTLLRAVAGLQGIDAGTVRMDGAVVSRPGWEQPPYARRVGMVFQRSALWPHMTIAGNVRFAIQGPSRSDAEHVVTGLLEAMGIADLAARFPDEVSGGEARRAALARALASRPRILLMDEPLTGVDAPRKEGLVALIRSVVDGQLAERSGGTELPSGLQERAGRRGAADRASVASEGGHVLSVPGAKTAGARDVVRDAADAADGRPAMLYVTHDPGQAREVADRIVRLEEGRLTP